jgi:hypothetical protein
MQTQSPKRFQAPTDQSGHATKPLHNPFLQADKANAKPKSLITRFQEGLSLFLASAPPKTERPIGIFQLNATPSQAPMALKAAATLPATPSTFRNNPLQNYRFNSLR